MTSKFASSKGRWSSHVGLLDFNVVRDAGCSCAKVGQRHARVDLVNPLKCLLKVSGAVLRSQLMVHGLWRRRLVCSRGHDAVVDVEFEANLVVLVVDEGRRSVASFLKGRSQSHSSTAATSRLPPCSYIHTKCLQTQGSR